MSGSRLDFALIIRPPREGVFGAKICKMPHPLKTFKEWGSSARKVTDARLAVSSDPLVFRHADARNPTYCFRCLPLGWQ